MNISDLKIGKYVVVNDLGASKYSSGMRVIGKVVEIDDKGNYAIIESLPKHRYEITDFNDFELWSKQIEDKTESMSKTSVKWNENKNLELYDGHEIKVPDELLENPNSNLVDYVSEEIRKHQSNDVQQRKRKDNVNSPPHYNYGDIEVIDFIEQVTKHYNPNVAYHIGNAIKYLARSPHKNGKEDIAKAKWYIERAFEQWDVK
ncbi:DUF3310 domain-containing protein [Staphylococcus cohnii]|uniref:DUF3310 domain-containing protein n=1 Tax=Staphylococcus cohnii TaxID=29382 RepID=UPI00254DA70B|nr:DUF3310 domain-containing protein [Staphylococcus cohnii]WIL68783.1 DUF3310 domain-containing protein [Staphylococcus cohnii]